MIILGFFKFSVSIQAFFVQIENAHKNRLMETQFDAFCCCGCWSLSSYKRLYILLSSLIYSNASWSVRSSHVWSVAVLWEPQICKKSNFMSSWGQAVLTVRENGFRKNSRFNVKGNWCGYNMTNSLQPCWQLCEHKHRDGSYFLFVFLSWLHIKPVSAFCHPQHYLVWF